MGRVGLFERRADPAALSCGDLELVQALAVVGQGHQVPLARHLVEAAQGKAGEAEDRLDDAKDRLAPPARWSPSSSPPTTPKTPT